MLDLATERDSITARIPIKSSGRLDQPFCHGNITDTIGRLGQLDLYPIGNGHGFMDDP